MRLTIVTELTVGLTWGLALATAAHAEPPKEPVEVRVDEVDVAGREIVASGVTWALESTAAIHVPGDVTAALGDVNPGMHVRLEFVPNDDPEPAVRTITVLPD